MNLLSTAKAENLTGRIFDKFKFDDILLQRPALITHDTTFIVSIQYIFTCSSKSLVMVLHGESSSSSDSFKYLEGYHKYKSIWDASIGEIVNCSCKPDNLHDDNAESVVRRGIISGHVPHHLSRGFSLFLDGW